MSTIKFNNKSTIKFKKTKSKKNNIKSKPSLDVRLMDQLSIFYFKVNYSTIIYYQRHFLIHNWLNIVFKETSAKMSWEEFYKKYKLRIKLVQPPENL